MQFLWTLTYFYGILNDFYNIWKTIPTQYQFLWQFMTWHFVPFWDNLWPFMTPHAFFTIFYVFLWNFKDFYKYKINFDDSLWLSSDILYNFWANLWLFITFCVYFMTVWKFLRNYEKKITKFKTTFVTFWKLLINNMTVYVFPMIF